MSRKVEVGDLRAGDLFLFILKEDGTEHVGTVHQHNPFYGITEITTDMELGIHSISNEQLVIVD